MILMTTDYNNFPKTTCLVLKILISERKNNNDVNDITLRWGHSMHCSCSLMQVRNQHKSDIFSLDSLEGQILPTPT